MKKISLTLIMIITLINTSNSQTNSFEEFCNELFKGYNDTIRRSVVKMKGNYNTKGGRFGSGIYYSNWKKFVDSNNRVIEYGYSCEYFMGHVGSTKLRVIIPTNSGQECAFENYGVIDTSGSILVPFEYDNIDFADYDNSSDNTLETVKYYIFRKNDTIGIVRIDNKIMCMFPPEPQMIADTFYNKSGSSYYRNTVLNRKNFYRIQKNKFHSDYFAYNYNGGKLGIISLLKGERILPPEYDKIDVYRDYAICRKNDSIFAFELKTEKMSKAYKDICLSDDQKVFIVKLLDNNLHMACNNIFDANNSQNYNFGRDSLVCYYNKETIAIEKGKYGVLNNSGQPIIPFKYDDIYFLENEYYYSKDIEMYLVKKDGLWAISNKKDSLLTGFEFVDVEKYNQINFDNMMYYAKPDTSESAYISSNSRCEKRDYYDGQDKLNIVGREIALKINTHVISIQRLEYLTVKKKDGYHVVKFIYKSHNNERSLTGLIVSPNTWDNIYMFNASLMERLIGVKLNNKFGYIHEKYFFDDIIDERDDMFKIIYDGLVYLPKYFNRKDDYNPCGVIMKNKVYMYSIWNPKKKLKRYRD